MADELLLIPGPTMLDWRVRHVMSCPQMGHVTPDFYAHFTELLALTKRVFRCSTGFPFVITGPGTVGMEAAVVSLIEPGDRTLVLDTGYFGNRFTILNEVHGAQVEVLKFDIGRHADPGAVEEKLASGGFKAVFMTHVETSNGVINPLPELVAAARKHGAFAVVDSVCGLGGCALNFDTLEADIVLTGSQKALAGPPGATLLCVSERALAAFETRKTPIASYYLNLLRWKQVMDDPKIYLATPAVQVLLALEEALHMVEEEGLENRWRRHHQIAAAIRAGLRALNLAIVAEEGHQADTVTGFYVPDAKAGALWSALRERFGILLGGGLGELKGKILRIGHLGNVTAKDALTLLASLEAAARALGLFRERADAVGAAAPYLTELGVRA